MSHLYILQKVVLWKRHYIPSVFEADKIIEKLKKGEKEGLTLWQSLHEELRDADVDVVDELEEEVSVADNDGLATIKLYDAITGLPLYKNSPENEEQ